jgi:anti-anti-sigma factor
VEIKQERGIFIVRLNGADLKDPLALHKRFEQVIIHDGARKLLVDLTDVSYMNSMQIGAVVGLHVLAYENLSVVKFVGMHERISNLFTLLGVDTLLDMHYARATGALESFGVYEPGEEGEPTSSPASAAGSADSPGSEGAAPGGAGR